MHFYLLIFLFVKVRNGSVLMWYLIRKFNTDRITSFVGCLWSCSNPA